MARRDNTELVEISGNLIVHAFYHVDISRELHGTPSLDDLPYRPADRGQAPGSISRSPITPESDWEAD